MHLKTNSILFRCKIGQIADAIAKKKITAIFAVMEDVEDIYSMLKDELEGKIENVFICAMLLSHEHWPVKSTPTLAQTSLPFQYHACIIPAPEQIKKKKIIKDKKKERERLMMRLLLKKRFLVIPHLSWKALFRQEVVLQKRH